MGYYWLDASVLIQAHQGPYNFDIAPGFWEALSQGADDGHLRSPDMVFQEIKPGDDLEIWVKAHKDPLFVNADHAVQTKFGPIAAHVHASYSPAWAMKFLAGADPWVIAHAQADSGIVVTLENRLRPARVKIPIICDQFAVESISTYEMLRRLGIKLKV
jgi:hypothetical protein